MCLLIKILLLDFPQFILFLERRTLIMQKKIENKKKAATNFLLYVRFGFNDLTADKKKNQYYVLILLFYCHNFIFIHLYCSVMLCLFQNFYVCVSISLSIIKGCLHTKKSPPFAYEINENLSYLFILIYII